MIGWIKFVLFWTRVFELFCTNGCVDVCITVLKLGVIFDWFPCTVCALKVCWLMDTWLFICWWLVWFVPLIFCVVNVKSEWSQVIFVESFCWCNIGKIESVDFPFWFNEESSKSPSRKFECYR